MKTILLMFVAMCMSLSLLAQPQAPRGKEWKVVDKLTDEFDTWDDSKWFKSLWNYGVPVQMKAENSGVSDGKLWIKATLDQGAERWFKTSRVMSKTKIKFPMYTECSMRTAHISAYNTFWTNNGNISNRDEIDICENNSKPSIVADQSVRPWKMYSQYFVVKNDVTEREHANFDNRNLDRTNPLKGVAWNEAFHTLGMWWKDEHTVQFYLDGEEAGLAETVQPFTLDQSIIWDLWTIDANWSGGIASQSDLSVDSINTMYVDWIHTYTLEEVESSLESEVSYADIARLYIKPSEKMLVIDFVKDIQGAGELKLYNQQGQLIKQYSMFKKYSEYDLHQLPSGLYHLNLIVDDKRMTQTLVL